MQIGNYALDFETEWQWQIIDWGMACMSVAGLNLVTNEDHFFNEPGTKCNSAIDLTVLLHTYLRFPATRRFASQFFTAEDADIMSGRDGAQKADFFGYYYPKEDITPKAVFRALRRLDRYKPRVQTPPPAPMRTQRARARSASPKKETSRRIFF